MQTLSGNVGEGGKNARQDVALVQAILRLTGRPAKLDPGRTKYLQGTIDGDCGKATKAALRQFQYDNVFVTASGNASQAAAGATAGIVAPEDGTWAKLVSLVPDEFADLRVLTGSKTVYAAATMAQRTASVARLNQLTFEAAFRVKILNLINRIADTHGIAIGVCRDGDRRSFQLQYELLTSGRNVTRAGPGESNHNFGQGVDLGFENLRWIDPDGKVVENETSWLHRLDPAQQATGEALIFWNMLRDQGRQVGMHPGPPSDRPHLQAWNDAGIDMANRLADLLTRSGRMRWTGRHQRYQCDLGYGGQFFEVGSAAQIWNRQATVTVDMLTRAAAQSPTRPASGSSPTPPRMPVPAGTRPSGGLATAQGVSAMQGALRADFEAADSTWQSWRAR